MNLNYKNIFFIFLVFPILGLTSNLELEKKNNKELSKKFNNYQDYINHHIKDSHELNLFYSKKNNISCIIPLPVLFWDNKFILTMSNKFNNNNNFTIKNNNQFYKLYHEKIYKTNSLGDLKFNSHGIPTVPKIIFDFSITKTLVAILFVSLFMCILFISLANSYKRKLIPTGIGRILEPIIIFICDEIIKPNIGEKYYNKYSTYLLTLFFFILFLNILGLLPFGFNATGNIVVTFFLAMTTYLVTHFNASKNYWKHIFWMPKVPILMKILLMPIEFIGTLTKPFALMMRLFANITAGHVIIMTLLSMVYIFSNTITIFSFSFLTLFIYLLEILVCFLQAYIFTILSSLFIGIAIKDNHCK